MTGYRGRPNNGKRRPVIRSDGEVFPSIAAAAASIDADPQHIYDVCRGKRKSHRGYGWSYA